VARLAVGPDV